jgi:hypothetical protein
MIQEHDRVVLTANIAAEHLTVGDVGTVVHIYAGDKAYEVEFVTLSGQTAAVVTLGADQIRAVRSDEISHARERSAA